MKLVERLVAVPERGSSSSSVYQFLDRLLYSDTISAKSDGFFFFFVLDFELFSDVLLPVLVLPVEFDSLLGRGAMVFDLPSGCWKTISLRAEECKLVLPVDGRVIKSPSSRYWLVYHLFAMDLYSVTSPPRFANLDSFVFGEGSSDWVLPSWLARVRLSDAERTD